MPACRSHPRAAATTPYRTPIHANCQPLAADRLGTNACQEQEQIMTATSDPQNPLAGVPAYPPRTGSLGTI